MISSAKCKDHKNIHTNRKSRKPKKIQKKCVSTKNNKSMERCCSSVINGNDLCGIHKRCRLLILPDGSLWKNIEKSSKLTECVKKRDSVLFWDIISDGYPWSKLSVKYRPSDVSYMKNNKNKNMFLRSELKRMGFSFFDREFIKNKYIKPNRLFWFTNLVYFLGNFPMIVKRIEKFYFKFVKNKIQKKRDIVNKITKRYRNKKMIKMLPLLVKRGKIWKQHNCININDPITNEDFVNVPSERWVICNNLNNTWWFDVSSAVQLLGSPGSHAGENPYNRKEYPPEFILEADYKLQKLNNKYEDLSYLINNNFNNDSKAEYKPSPCYDYNRFLVRVKATKLFESFKEHGYNFPAKIFIDFNLSELRVLAIKISEYWQMFSIEDRKNIIPDGKLFSNNFIRNITSYGNITELRIKLLNIASIFALNPNNKSARESGCINIMMILATINKKSHDIAKKYGLCECAHLHIPPIDRYNEDLLEQIPPDIIREYANDEHLDLPYIDFDEVIEI
jgi:hypothetical protein